MKRYFYLSTDLDGLEKIERELEGKGLLTPQIHVISKNEAGLDQLRLNQVHQWFQTDVVHSTLKGAVLGLLAALTAVGGSYALGLMAYVGTVPFVFLSIILLGFCTWEAGFIGTQLPNRHFKRFAEAINSGRHLLMVDVNPNEVNALRQVCAGHPKLEEAGQGGGAPKWTILGQHKIKEFSQWAP